MWNVLCLEHDAPSKELKGFFEKRWTDGVSHLNVREGGKYDRTAHYSCEIQELLKPLKEIEGNPLTIYGHGSFHHYTYGMVGNVMPQRTDSFLYIHIDMHTDAGVCTTECPCETGHGLHKCGMSLGCGSFVEELADHGARNFLFIGTDAKCGWKRKKWVRQDDIFMAENLPSLIAHELKKKRHSKCYVSMDLDVLDHKEIPTGYGRGKITLRHLLTILTTIQDHKEILGADILGLCKKGNGSYYARGSKPEHYYQATGYLTYGIIAAHLAGKDYQDAMQVRDKMIEMDEAGKNGKTWRKLAKGVAF